MSSLYLHGTYAYKHPLFSIFSEELTTVYNHFVALLQTRIPTLTKKLNTTEWAFLGIFWYVQKNLTSKYQSLKTYFCILYSKLFKVPTTELKCRNHPNSYTEAEAEACWAYIFLHPTLFHLVVRANGSDDKGPDSWKKKQGNPRINPSC